MIDFFRILLDGVADMFSLLDIFPVVSGVSVLDFLIAVAVISVIMPVLITLVKTMNTSKNVRIDKHGSDKKEDN